MVANLVKSGKKKITEDEHLSESVKKKNPFHIVTSMSPNPVTSSESARNLISFEAEVGATSGHAESDI